MSHQINSDISKSALTQQAGATTSLVTERRPWHQLPLTATVTTGERVIPFSNITNTHSDDNSTVTLRTADRLVLKNIQGATVIDKRDTRYIDGNSRIIPGTESPGTESRG